MPTGIMLSGRRVPLSVRQALGDSGPACHSSRAGGMGALRRGHWHEPNAGIWILFTAGISSGSDVPPFCDFAINPASLN